MYPGQTPDAAKRRHSPDVETLPCLSSSPERSPPLPRRCGLTDGRRRQRQRPHGHVSPRDHVWTAESVLTGVRLSERAWCPVSARLLSASGVRPDWWCSGFSCRVRQAHSEALCKHERPSWQVRIVKEGIRGRRFFIGLCHTVYGCAGMTPFRGINLVSEFILPNC